MKISIITTVYNGEKYIEEALESVLSQRGDFELEYFVIDAASTDSTFSKIQKHKKLVDSGFYSGRNLGVEMEIISEKDSGMYEGIAKGFKKCSGDVVAYINYDDFYSPNTFACVTEIFEQNRNVKWISGRCTMFNEKGHNIFSTLRIYDGRDLIKKGAYGLFSSYFIPQESTFWTKELLDKVNLNEFINYKKAGDFYLWYTFAKYENLYIVDSQFSGFRTVENQLSTDTDAYRDEMRQIVGDTKLSISEKIKLQKIIEINNKLIDSDKYKYGIFHYNKHKKMWTSRRNTYLDNDTITNLSKIKGKFNLKNFFKKIIVYTTKIN